MPSAANRRSSIVNLLFADADRTTWATPRLDPRRGPGARGPLLAAGGSTGACELDGRFRRRIIEEVGRGDVNGHGEQLLSHGIIPRDGPAGQSRAAGSRGRQPRDNGGLERRLGMGPESASAGSATAGPLARRSLRLGPSGRARTEVTRPPAAASGLAPGVDRQHLRATPAAARLANSLASRPAPVVCERLAGCTLGLRPRGPFGPGGIGLLDGCDYRRGLSSSFARV